MSGNDSDILKTWAATGDADAFAELVGRYGPLVYSAAARVLRNSTDAEDVTQQCFLELAQRPPAIRTTLAGWLHRLATHRALNHVRGEARRREREAAFDAEQRENAVHNTNAWADISDHIDEALAAVKPAIRDVIILRYYRGESPEDVAKTLGIAPRTVRHRQQQGIEQVRAYLRKRGLLVATGLSALLGQGLYANGASVPATLQVQLGKLALSGIRPVPPSGMSAWLGAGASTKMAVGATLTAVLLAGIYLVIAPKTAPSAPNATPVAVASESETPVNASSLAELTTPTVAPVIAGPKAMDGPHALTLLARNADEKPVAAADLVALRSKTSLGTSDDGGFLKVNALPETAEYLELRADAYQTLRLSTIPRLQVGPVQVESHLITQPEVSVRLFDDQGIPLAGAEIVVKDEGQSQVVALSDEAGWVHYREPKRRSDVFIRHPDYGVQPLDPNGYDGEAQIAFLNKTGTISLTATLDGMPVPGVTVTCSNDKRFSAPRTTDEEGKVHYSEVISGEDLLFMLRHETSTGTALLGDALVVVGPGKVRERSVSLRAPDTYVTGKVLWDDRTPCSNCAVVSSSLDNPNRQFIVHAEDNGAYRVPLFPDANVLRVDNLPEPGGLTERVVVHGSSATPTLKRDLLVSRPAPDAPGALIGPNGSTAVALDFEGRDTPDVLAILEDGSRSGSSIGRFATPADGLLKFASLNSGQKLIALVDEANRVGGVWHTSHGTVPRGNSLSMDIPVGALEGILRDQHQQPVPHVTIHIYPENWPMLTVQTNSDGHYRVWPLPTPTKLVVRIEAPGYFQASARGEFRADGDALTVQLQRRDTPLSGSVVYADGTPVLRGVVRCDGPEGADTRLIIADGRFSGNLLPGRWRLEATDGLADSERQEILLPRGEISLVIDALPQGEEAIRQAEIENMLKQLGLVFKMFANESEGEAYPPVSKTYGRLTPETEAIYPEYLAESIFLERLAGTGAEQFCYLGYAVDNEAATLAYLDLYESVGPEGLADYAVTYELDGETFTVPRLHEDFGRNTNQSTIPTLWQVPDPERDTRGWVLFMDGHTEWRDYPGEFPMTEAVITRLRQLQAAAQ